MTTTEQATTAATRLARFAAMRNTGLTSCPYPAGATGPAAAARRVWLAEYARRRPVPIDYSNGLLALAHGPDDGDDGAPVTPAEPLFGGES
jgi:hypothetical protein